MDLHMYPVLAGSGLSSMAKKRLGTDVERLCVDMQWEERDDMSC